MRMKKFVNKPENLVRELLEGFALAFPDKICLASPNTISRRVSKSSEKVRLVTLGGSGHEPGLSGFVGEGMYACAGGSSTLLIVLNHAGDVLSANIAMDAALREGLNVKIVLTHDDVAGGPKPRGPSRTGWVFAGI